MTEGDDNIVYFSLGIRSISTLSLPSLTSAHHHLPSLQLLPLDAIAQVTEEEHAIQSTLYHQVQSPRQDIFSNLTKYTKLKKHTYGDD